MGGTEVIFLRERTCGLIFILWAYMPPLHPHTFSLLFKAILVQHAICGAAYEAAAGTEILERKLLLQNTNPGYQKVSRSSWWGRERPYVAC